MTTRIELCGRIVNPPALRVTPAGTAVLSLLVDCGPKAGALVMPVVMTGEAVRTLATRLKNGVEVRIDGSLRSTGSRNRAGSGDLGVEVVANDLVAAGETNIGTIRKLNDG